MQETVEVTQSELQPARHLVLSWIDEISTEPLPRGRAIDSLLDLRSLLPDESPLRREVDRHLRNVPGVRLVAASWWADTAAYMLFVIDRHASE